MSAGRTSPSSLPVKLLLPPHNHGQGGGLSRARERARDWNFNNDNPDGIHGRGREETRPEATGE